VVVGFDSHRYVCLGPTGRTIAIYGQRDEKNDGIRSRLAKIQRRLVQHTSIEAAYQEELNRAMADIPATHVILRALPESIIQSMRWPARIKHLQYDTTW
jgi:hypothetical protein